VLELGCRTTEKERKIYRPHAFWLS